MGNNKTGCRMIVEDAYNEEHVIRYYTFNGFKMLFSEEAQEIEYYQLANNSLLPNRLMFFDWRSKRAIGFSNHLRDLILNLQKDHYVLIVYKQ